MLIGSAISAYRRKESFFVGPAVKGSDTTLRRWFERAAFDVSHLPCSLTLWRGGLCFYEDVNRWQVPFTLLRGVAWTQSRGAACWFATRLDALFGERYYPCVIRVRTPRKYVLAHITERNEDECIAFTRRLRSHIIDGTDINPRTAKDLLRWRPTLEQVAEWKAVGASWKAERAPSSV